MNLHSSGMSLVDNQDYYNSVSNSDLLPALSFPLESELTRQGRILDFQIFFLLDENTKMLAHVLHILPLTAPEMEIGSECYQCFIYLYY